MKNLVEDYGELKRDNLINGLSTIITKSVKIKKSSDYKRGTLLGIVEATGYAVPVDSTKEDGSQNADCILAMDVLADEDAFVVAYSAGEFNREEIILVGKETIDKHEKELRKLGIFLKDNI